MAILRPSSLIGAISGTLGSIDYVQGATGLYVRKRPRSTIRHSPILATRRNHFLRIVRHWREMTESQRQAWRSAAALSNFKNRLGTPRKLSGFQLFLQINLSPFIGTTIHEEAPNNLTATAAPSNVSIRRLPGQPIEALFTISTPSGLQLIWIFCARPVSTRQPRNYSNWKLVITGITTTGDKIVNMSVSFPPVLGNPQVDEHIGIKIRSRDPGRLFSYAVTGDGIML